MNLVHGTVVAIGDAGILLLGPSGSGKSDLALRMMADGAQLVADDQVELAVIDEGIWAKAPAILAGLIEVRGVGIRQMAFRQTARLSLMIDLTPGATPERLPEMSVGTMLGQPLRSLRLAAFEASAPLKAMLALHPEAAGRLDPPPPTGAE